MAKDILYDKQKQVDIIDVEKRHDSLAVIQQNQKLHSIIYLLSGLILFVSLVSVLFYLYKDRKRLNKINKQQQLLDKKEQLLAKLADEIKQKAAINTNTNKEEIMQIREKMLQAKKEILILRCEKLQHSASFLELKERLNSTKKYLSFGT